MSCLWCVRQESDLHEEHVIQMHFKEKTELIKVCFLIV